MKIVVLCTLTTGLMAIAQALKLGVKIEKIIGLHPRKVNNNYAISGYVDIKDFCYQYGINFCYVNNYNLNQEDPSTILKEVDLLWVTGWQRLIPQSFINQSNYGAIGAHGSCDGIINGRGRSPQNWALLIGSKSFEISIFKITPNIDDGDVIASKKFTL